MKEFRRDFRRRMNRSCRLNMRLVGREVTRGSTKLLPSEEDAIREAYGLRKEIRIRIIPVKIPGNFPVIFPVFIPETDFLFSPRFRRACRVRTYFEYKRMVSMRKPVRNLFTNFSGFSFRRFPEVPSRNRRLYPIRIAGENPAGNLSRETVS